MLVETRIGRICANCHSVSSVGAQVFEQVGGKIAGLVGANMQDCWLNEPSFCCRQFARYYENRTRRTKRAPLHWHPMWKHSWLTSRLTITQNICPLLFEPNMSHSFQTYHQQTNSQVHESCKKWWFQKGKQVDCRTLFACVPLDSLFPLLFGDASEECGQLLATDFDIRLKHPWV